MPVKMKTLLTARGYELDSYNHVNNAVYLNYFEQARWEFFRDLGLLDHLRETGDLPVVTEVRIRYQREIKLFDELEVESVCREEKPYLVFHQKLINRTLGAPAARATTRLLFLDREKVPRDIPAAILAAL